MSDPREFPGLAHFLEHMLFLGTQKYPEENAYHKFIHEHGGSSNAFTSSEFTNFHFDCSPAFLAPALDHFAQFFISPLFTESATEREVNAVHSEHQKNIQVLKIVYFLLLVKVGTLWTLEFVYTQRPTESLVITYQEIW